MSSGGLDGLRDAGAAMVSVFDRGENNHATAAWGTVSSSEFDSWRIGSVTRSLGTNVHSRPSSLVTLKEMNAHAVIETIKAPYHTCAARLAGYEKVAGIVREYTTDIQARDGRKHQQIIIIIMFWNSNRRDNPRCRRDRQNVRFQERKRENEVIARRSDC